MKHTSPNPSPLRGTILPTSLVFQQTDGSEGGMLVI